MLEVLIDIVCPTILIMTGLCIVKTLIGSKEKILTKRNVMLIVIGTIISFISYQTKYPGFNTLVSYIINIIIYKEIFNKTIIQAVILSSLVMIVMFLSDIICGFPLLMIYTTSELKNIWYLRLLCNMITCSVVLIFTFCLYKKGVTKNINKKLDILNNNEAVVTVVFMIIVFIIICYNLFVNEMVNSIMINNIILVAIFCYLLYVYVKEKDKHNSLLNEYDSLFNYIQTFEDWIEKDQLNRHEYKNQLAVLRCLTKEKKVKNKIDEILEDNINIEGQAVTNLKNLPKGGIKGLMYYKSAIAQKHKINLITEVSIESKGILTKLSEKEIRILCKLIGIYFDNAIEASAESRKKNLSIEIYELKDKVNFVFSNTFKKHKNLNNRNKKGVSSKGKGRGNGLYFASKLIKENKWITQKQEIIDNYYIQELTIKKVN